MAFRDRQGSLIGKLVLLGAGLCLALGAPAAVATPLQCASPCMITAEGWGYNLPVAEIGSGRDVLWTTDEPSHPTGEALQTGNRCFEVAVGKNQTPTPVRFDIAGGTLQATTPAGTKTCGSAIGIPAAGGFALAFRCLLHPYMNGLLLVLP